MRRIETSLDENLDMEELEDADCRIVIQLGEFSPIMLMGMGR